MINNIDFYLTEEDTKKYQEWYSNNHILERDLEVLHVSNGIVLPCLTFEDQIIGKYYKGGIVDKDQKYITISGLYHSPSKINQRHLLGCTEGYSVLKKNIEYKKGLVIYGGIFEKHWGHFLLESLSRIWFHYKNTELPIVFISLDNKKPTDQFAEIFELLKIPKDKILFIDKPTQFDEIIVPEASFILSNYAHNSFLIPFEQIIKNITPHNFKKIYISRTKFKQNKNIIGEEIFEKTFQKNGFKVIYPEELSVKEQISYIRGADQIAGFISSGIHNSVFARPETKIIILEKFALMNGTQGIINLIKKLKVTYIDTFYTFLPVAWGEGPFLVGISNFLINYMEKENFSYIPQKTGISNGNLIDFLKKWGETYKKSKGYMVNPTIEESIKLINKVFNKDSFIKENFYKIYYKNVIYFIKKIRDRLLK